MESSANLTQEQKRFLKEDLIEREKQISLFCEQQADRLTRVLNQTYKEGKKSLANIDET